MSTPVFPGLVATPVTTILTPVERLHVDAAGEGIYRTLHRESLNDVLADLKANRAGAVLISVARCGIGDATYVATMVREFPRIPAVALLSNGDSRSAQVVLALGRTGVRTLVDVRDASGWYQLRRVIASARADDINEVALQKLAVDLTGAPPDCWYFFEALFRVPNSVTTVRVLAKKLRVVPSTLMSRFFRARLPAPKRYLAMTRLVRAAQMFENPGLSVANVANQLEYSSPQSFGRHVRSILQMTALTFRQYYDGEGMLQRFRDDLVLPHREMLRQFTPLVSSSSTDPDLAAGEY